MKSSHILVFVLALIIMSLTIIPGALEGAMELLSLHELWIRIGISIVICLLLATIKPIRKLGVLGLVIILVPLMITLIIILWELWGWWLIIVPAAAALVYGLFKSGVSFGKLRIPKASRSWDFIVLVFTCIFIIALGYGVKVILEGRTPKEIADDVIYRDVGKGYRNDDIAHVGPRMRWSGTTLPIGNAKFAPAIPYRWEHESNTDVYLAPKKTGDQVVLKYYNTSRNTSWTRKVTRIGPGQWDFNTEDIDGKSIAAVGDKMLVIPQNTVEGVVSINYR